MRGFALRGAWCQVSVWYFAERVLDAYQDETQGFRWAVSLIEFMLWRSRLAFDIRIAIWLRTRVEFLVDFSFGGMRRDTAPSAVNMDKRSV